MVTSNVFGALAVPAGHGLGKTERLNNAIQHGSTSQSRVMSRVLTLEQFTALAFAFVSLSKWLSARQNKRAVGRGARDSFFVVDSDTVTD
jgi:hypothetical protein